MGQWKAGDVVMVKSGGPKMTVGTVKADGRVICEWFDEKTGLVLSAVVDDSKGQLPLLRQARPPTDPPTDARS